MESKQGRPSRLSGNLRNNLTDDKGSVAAVAETKRENRHQNLGKSLVGVFVFLCVTESARSFGVAVYDAVTNLKSEDYFINSNAVDDPAAARDGGGGGGYWEPHTSSIDFCESNYSLSRYVTEPHNSLSSLWGLSGLGVVGMRWGNPMGELRFTIVYGILTFIGIGSALLHGTLHWFWQSSDELPMIYLAIAIAYCMIENDVVATTKDDGSSSKRRPWLPHVLVALCIVDTLVYFLFQKIYIVFLGTFMSIVTAIVLLYIKFVLKQKRLTLDGNELSKNNARVALRLCRYNLLCAIFSSPVWCVDQLWCDKFTSYYDALPSLLRGCTLHVVWHVAAGLTAHVATQFLVACRMSVLGMPCRIRFIVGVIPSVAHKKETNKLETSLASYW